MDVNREEYLNLRKLSTQEDNFARFDILRLYFIHKGGASIDVHPFRTYLVAAIEDDPNLQSRIDFMYPLILKYMDHLCDITFTIKDYGENSKVLLAIT